MSNKPYNNKHPIPTNLTQIILYFLWPPNTILKKIAITIIAIIMIIVGGISIYIAYRSNSIGNISIPANPTTHESTPRPEIKEIPKQTEKTPPSKRQEGSAKPISPNQTATDNDKIKQWPDERYNR